MNATDPSIHKQLDIEYHRAAAAKYDQQVTRNFHFYHVHSLYPWARSFICRFSEPSVLDVGTGTGVVACTMAKYGCRVSAIDHSPEMLAIAKVRASEDGVLSRTMFMVGDSEHLQFDNDSFDAVTIQGMLHHLPSIEPTLREAVRVLRPGGELYISEPCIESTPISNAINRASRWLRRLLGVKTEIVPADHEAPIEGARLISLLRSMGLETSSEYLAHIKIVRFLPEFMRLGVTLLCSMPTRHTRGDIVFVIAKKRAFDPFTAQHT